MKAYGGSWGYNVHDCLYCLYWKGKLRGCVCPDGRYCPVPQKPVRQNDTKKVYKAKVDSEHIHFVVEGLKENTARIRNMHSIS